MESKEIKYTNPSKTSRYKKLKTYLNATNLYFANPSYIEIPEHRDDKFFSVTLQYENRLDLISHKFYNDSKLWWVIAKANFLNNPLEVPSNTILRIPAISTLFGAGGVIGNG